MTPWLARTKMVELCALRDKLSLHDDYCMRHLNATIARMQAVMTTLQHGRTLWKHEESERQRLWKSVWYVHADDVDPY